MLTIAFPAEEGAAGLRPVGTGAEDWIAIDAEEMVRGEDGCDVGAVAAAVESDVRFIFHRLKR